MTPADPGTPCPDVELGPLYAAATKHPNDCGFPVDHSHETPAMTALERRGFTADFVVDGGALRVAGTDRRFRPEEVRIRDYYRFEGSYADPAIGAVVDRMVVSISGH